MRGTLFSRGVNDRRLQHRHGAAEAHDALIVEREDDDAVLHVGQPDVLHDLLGGVGLEVRRAAEGFLVGVDESVTPR